MRTSFLTLALLTALAGVAAPAQAQVPDTSRVLNLSFDQDGRVTLSARNVTVREILGEWARQCGCYVVNGDKLPGAPLSIPLLYEHETQAKVLESLLRQASGYVLTPQRAGAVSKSNFETIYILATSSAVAASAGYPTVATPNPYANPTTGAPDDELPPILPPGAPRPMPPSPSSAPPPPGSEYPGAGSAIPGQSPNSLPTSRPAGVSTTFVPIRPVDSSQSTTPQTMPPGSPSPAAPPIPTGTPGR
ncbi:MAG: hypothetical protein ABI634_00870 [Acidobacteriota bacterium]